MNCSFWLLRTGQLSHLPRRLWLKKTEIHTAVHISSFSSLIFSCPLLSSLVLSRNLSCSLIPHSHLFSSICSSPLLSTLILHSCPPLLLYLVLTSPHREAHELYMEWYDYENVTLISVFLFPTFISLPLLSPPSISLPHLSHTSLPPLSVTTSAEVGPSRLGGVRRSTSPVF